MKWALVAGGIIVALVLVVVVVGARLPRNHAVAMSARVTAPPASVWAALADPARYPTWRKDVQTIEMLPPAPTGPRWRERSRRGQITMVMDTMEPTRRLVTRIADDDVPFGGAWEILIEPDGASMSRVTITERGYVSNPAFRFVSRFIMGQTASIDGYLRALGEHFGAEPIPAVVPVAEAVHGA